MHESVCCPLWLSTRIASEINRKAEKPRAKNAWAAADDGLGHADQRTTVEIKGKVIRDVEVHANELQTGRLANGCIEGNAAELQQAAGATSRSADASQRRLLDACAHFLAIRFLICRQQLGRIGIGRRRAVRIGEKTLQAEQTKGIEHSKSNEMRRETEATPVDARCCCCVVWQAIQAWAAPSRAAAVFAPEWT